MLRVKEFREYIEEIETQITELSASETVIDDSQLSKFLEEIDPNVYLILGIIPKHKFIGKPENLQSNDIASILVLKKIERTEQCHEIFLDVINETQIITEKVIAKLLADYNNDENCNFMRKLNLPSFDINPIWGLNSCDGYQIDFTLNSDV